jgi:hypothetical protein
MEKSRIRDKHPGSATLPIPLPAQRVCTHSTAGEGDGGQYFGMTSEIGLPSYSKICTLWFERLYLHPPGGDGDGGSIFWKTREIGLPSYSKICTLWFERLYFLHIFTPQHLEHLVHTRYLFVSFHKL